MDTNDIVETTVPGVAPAKPAPKPEPPVPEEHPEERATGEPVHEPEPVSTVLGVPMMGG